MALGLCRNSSQKNSNVCSYLFWIGACSLYNIWLTYSVIYVWLQCTTFFTRLVKILSVFSGNYSKSNKVRHLWWTYSNMPWVTWHDLLTNVLATICPQKRIGNHSFQHYGSINDTVQQAGSDSPYTHHRAGNTDTQTHKHTDTHKGHTHTQIQKQKKHRDT